MENETPESEWRAGWKVLLSALLGCFAGVFYLSGIMVLAKPMTQIFAWSRAEVMMSVLIISTVMLFTVPLAGAVVDRVGPRRVALTGMPIAAILVSCVGLSGPQIWTWYVAWALAACGATMQLQMIWMIGVSQNFPRNQGKAVGITLCGVGLSNAVGVPLAYFVYQWLGWRAVFPTLAAVAFLLAYPMVWLFFHDAQSKHLRREPSRADRTSSEDKPGLTFTDARRSSRFWRIALAMLLSGASANAVNSHYIALLTDRGIPGVKAALILAMVGPSPIAGRVLAGILFDAFYAPLVSLLLMIAPIISCVVLLGGTSRYEILIPITISMGLATASESQTAAYLVPKYFGYRSYGKILGFISGVTFLGMGLGPVIGGLAFDMTGSYTTMLLLVAGSLSTSALLIGTLGRYPTGWHSVDERATMGQSAHGDMARPALPRP